MARPTKFDPSMINEIVPFMSQGYSQEACAAKLGISVDTFFRWKKENKEFSEAVKDGVNASRLFWENLGVEGARGSGEFNATAWIFNMKNRFGWKDKQDVTSNNETINITLKSFARDTDT